MAALMGRLRRVDWGLVQTGALNVVVLGALSFIGLYTSVRSFEVDVEGVFTWLSGFLQNFSTEMYGAVLTFFLIEVLVGSRQARQAKREALKVEKDRLILEMGSPFNQSAVEAVRQLRWRGWLDDGSLGGANLVRANLEGADLSVVHLEGVDLSEANLKRTVLREAHLEGALLLEAHLEEACLERTHLDGAKLALANLESVSLDGAHLEGAKLTLANLEGADLVAAHLEGADLEYARLRGAILMGAWLEGAEMMGAWLEGAILSGAHLEGVDLEKANLGGAIWVTRFQLLQCDDMKGATLPDGTVLPDDDTWRAALEAWCETVPTDEHGHIVAAPLDGEDDD